MIVCRFRTVARPPMIKHGPGNLPRSLSLGAIIAALLVGMSLVGVFPVTAFSLTSSTTVMRRLRVLGKTPQHRQPAWCTAEVSGMSPANREHVRLGATSSVIETVAKAILNLALANPQQATVDCRVSSSAISLMRGDLHQAKVDGLNWTTPMGLTMRTITLTLNDMKIVPLDVFRGKITFKCPAEGRAVLSLNAEDFGNFLVHPLMSKADLPSGEFEFQKEGAVLDADNGRTTFAGMWRKQSVVMEACQPERFGTIYARAAQRGNLTDVGVQTLSEEMTRFFNTVVLDLDGTSVRFEDMHHGYSSKGDPLLRVTVGVEVHRVPNPKNMKF